MDPTVRWRLRRPLVCLWREPGVLQLGETLVLRGAPAEAPEVVAALAEGASWAALESRFPASGWIVRLLGELRRAGLLGTADAARGHSVRVLGDGDLVRTLGQGLRDDGLTTQTSRPPRLLTAAGVGPDAAHALTVLVPASCEPDRALTDALVRAGRSFLVVRLHGGRGSVGPLVVPGRTPCLRCDDLHRRDRDPAWPRLAAQLAHTPGVASPAAADWAGATARLQVQAFLAGTIPDALATVLDNDGVLRARRIELHPECGCPAAAAQENRLGTMAA